jgi:hypothetical protein
MVKMGTSSLVFYSPSGIEFNISEARIDDAIADKDTNCLIRITDENQSISDSKSDP